MPDLATKQLNILLIAGLTPYFLEKPFSWWEENEEEIIKKREFNPTWTKNTVLVEAGQKTKQSEFLRQISELGYEKVFNAIYPGTYKILGSAVIIHAINKKLPFAVDFLGNTIESITWTSDVQVGAERPILRTKNTELNLGDGDYVVHIDHGIGIFRGIVEKGGSPSQISKSETWEGKYFKIEYAPARKGGEPDVLFVPTAEKKRLEPYYGLERPRLARLGTQFWTKVKKRSREEIIAFAQELIKIHKNRVVQKRHPYLPDELEKNVWDSFEHELTKSQERAMEEIFADMGRDEPMERVLTGDVGFGKTELALRASLRSALSGRQTVILAPTTVLADQHFSVFKNRLRDTPVKVAMLSRLTSKKENKKILKELEDGELDIAIGTHRLFSKDIKFGNLGLVVIDEEQRFGVRHKEHFKKLHPASDILSLSATPIPRTLAFFLAGVRPASQIKEAPRGRLAPLTKVLPFSKRLIKGAIRAELKREGQVYYVSNRVRTIPKTLEMLGSLIPRAKLGSIHGRMNEGDIIETMRRFRKKEIDVLISTTIIENGLDISSVNALVAENAALLGLSQAHQLRGRIGRGETQAMAYFLYNPKNLPPKAEKRLANLLDFQELGSGLEIAKRDLEIRGAGNILGREQSGIANRIGWNLYFQFMNEATEEIK